jgi:hypothetical protein
MKAILFFVSGAIVALGLFVWRFWVCRDQYPSTDVLIDAMMRLEGAEDRPLHAS